MLLPGILGRQSSSSFVFLVSGGPAAVVAERIYFLSF
jgi:hypothetical protein